MAQGGGGGDAAQHPGPLLTLSSVRASGRVSKGLS